MNRIIILYFLGYFFLDSVIALAQPKKLLFLLNQQAGFGDVATNLWVAKKLKRNHPDLEISIAVMEREKDKFSILNGGLSKSPEGIGIFTPGHTIVEKYIPYIGQNYPVVRWNLNFSLFDCIISLSVMHNEGNALLTSEYPTQWEEHPTTPPALAFSEYAKAVPQSHRNDFDEEAKLFRFYMGVNNLGIHISPQRPSPPIPLEAFEKKFLLPKESKRGFCYGLIDHCTKYIEFINTMAKKDKFTPYTLFVGKEVKLSDKADNLRVIVQQPNLDESESLIAHSNLPVLVTGDISLTMALEYEKPFIYEMYPHKEESIKDIFSSILDCDPTSRLNFKDIVLEVGDSNVFNFEYIFSTHIQHKISNCIRLNRQKYSSLSKFLPLCDQKKEINILMRKRTESKSCQ